MSLGPIQTTFTGVPPNPQADGLGYNPKCLGRDVSKEAAYGSRDEEIMALITGNDNILDFQNRMQGDFANAFIGQWSPYCWTLHDRRRCRVRLL